MRRGTKIVIVLIVIASVFAGVTLYVENSLRQAFQRQFLVIVGTDVVATSAPPGAGIPADFGPHCARASFAQSGALIVDADAIPAGATGVVYMKYEHARDGTFNASGGGGDSVAVFFFRANATELLIVSPSNRNAILFKMENRNSTLLVNGTGYLAGQVYHGDFATPVTLGTTTWTVREAYTVTSRGVTTVTVQPSQPCA